MNIILLGKRHGQSRSMRLGSKSIAMVVVGFACLLALALVAGYAIATKVYAPTQKSLVDANVISAWDSALLEQKKALRDIEQSGRHQLDALTLKMGDMQARLYRLDALGQRLTQVAKLKNGEFDFDSSSSVGGPVVEQDAAPYSINGFETELKNLAQTIADREQQLAIMEQMFDEQKLANQAFIAGRPIKWGWMSSPYGYRSDPFTGRRAWHAGVDFAGKDGSDIIAVAAGVVTWSRERRAMETWSKSIMGMVIRHVMRTAKI